jgi:transcriptional regulator with XRE-family HTH domain
MQAKLLVARKRAGLTQRHMAELIGQTVSSYSKKERGERPISAREAILFARELKTTTEELIE